MQKRVTSLFAFIALGSSAALPVGGGAVSSASAPQPPRVRMLDLSSYSSAPPDQPVDLVFLHHSIGDQLLAERGPEGGSGRSHPNGGGLRRLLEDNHYRVHHATYGSQLGEHTDMFDWFPKFRDHTPQILRVAEQDSELPRGQRNRVVLFKSCFPNNYFVGEGAEPGSAEGPELTLANAKATMRALLPIFERHPETLFVYLTVPPAVGVARDEPLAKWLVKKILGKPSNVERLEIEGRNARAFNDWAASEDGWLATYPLANVAVFHLYDVLTGEGASNHLRYPSGADGLDDHPNAEGLRKVADALVPFLNRAVRRAGVVPTESAAAAP